MLVLVNTLESRPIKETYWVGKSVNLKEDKKIIDLVFGKPTVSKQFVQLEINSIG